MSGIVTLFTQTKQNVAEKLLNPIQKFLPASRIEQICIECKYRWRERAFGPAATLLACIVKHLHATPVSTRATEDYLQSLSTKKSTNRHGSNFCKARKRLPECVFKKLPSLSLNSLTTPRPHCFMA